MESQYFINRRKVKALGTRSPPKKTPGRGIAYRSEKRKKEQREYVKLVKEMFSESDRCEINSPECTGKAYGLDHLQKRSPSNLLKRSNLKRACNACNLYKELNPEWAMINGHSISKFRA